MAKYEPLSQALTARYNCPVTVFTVVVSTRGTAPRRTVLALQHLFELTTGEDAPGAGRRALRVATQLTVRAGRTAAALMHARALRDWQAAATRRSAESAAADAGTTGGGAAARAPDPPPAPLDDDADKGPGLAGVFGGTDDSGDSPSPRAVAARPRRQPPVPTPPPPLSSPPPSPSPAPPSRGGLSPSLAGGGGPAVARTTHGRGRGGVAGAAGWEGVGLGEAAAAASDLVADGLASSGGLPQCGVG